MASALMDARATFSSGQSKGKFPVSPIRRNVGIVMPVCRYVQERGGWAENPVADDDALQGEVMFKTVFFKR
jgi:hypothetical protein